MTGLAAYGLAGLWVLVHLASFFLLVRRSRGGASERAILAFHLLSFALFLAIAFALSAFEHAITITDALGATFLHAIYSLTFLELWALADGGISARILGLAVRHGGRVTTEELAEMTRYAEQKQKIRIDSLQQLGLVGRNPDDSLGLTVRGLVVAKAVRCLVFLNNAKDIC